jgi:hypothetical protein
MISTCTKWIPQHTPGPHSYRLDADGVDDLWIIESSSGDYLSEIRFWDCDEPEKLCRIKVNARLFAAAPQLLNALLHLLQVFEVGDPVANVNWSLIMDAIAQVKGRG